MIRFEPKTRVVLAALLVLFALATALELHGSSIAMWNRILPGREANAGVLLGEPRAIRGDEWSVTTLAMLSQAKIQPAFALENPGWGPDRVPLIFNLPASHWSMLVRPQYWGFFVLDLERGFAFFWNMKTLLLVGGIFLLLLVLTASDFWVSLLGTAWVFLSGFMQWWYSTPAMLPEMVGSFALLLVAAHYLALSASRLVIAASALALTVFTMNAALSIYPPFQIPLFYLGIAILVGSLGPRVAAGLPRDALRFRVGCAAVALIAVGALLLAFYVDARPTIARMLGTVYPGARTATGGDVTLAQVFSGFYGFFMSEGDYPRTWQNVCEASNFVLLFPVPMAALLWRAWKRQPVSALEWSLAAYLALVLVWMTVGFPKPLALVTGFGLSQGTRSLLGLGLGGALFCCVFLAKARVDAPAGVGPQLTIAALIAVLLAAFALDFNRATDGFATLERAALVSLVGAAAGVFLLARKRALFAAAILVPSLWSFGLVNPLARGLGPILDTKLFQAISPLVEREPDARWTVYGPYILADFLKTTGASVFNGTQVVPPLEDLRVIDPDGIAASTYNRYAHVALLPVIGEGARFDLRHADSYTIEIDPKSDVWRELGIRYVTLPIESPDPEFLRNTALALALPDLGIWVYEYRWSQVPR